MFFIIDRPVFFSPPHFYLGDHSLVDDINGMHPNKTLHETYIDVEPVSITLLTISSALKVKNYYKAVEHSFRLRSISSTIRLQNSKEESIRRSLSINYGFKS